MKNIIYFLFLGFCTFGLSSCTADQSAELEALKTKLADAEKQISKKMETPKPGLIHTVFFWLKEDISAEDKAKFKAGVQSLSKISHIQSCFIGPAAGTESRDVVDHSYSLALINHFASKEAEAAYQIDPIHLKFIDDCKDYWTKVIVYDSLVD